MAHGAKPLSVIRWIERFLWTIALVAVCYGCFCFWESASARRQLSVKAAQRKSVGNSDVEIVPDRVADQMFAGSAQQPGDDGSVIGEIEIPQLGFVAPITTGLTKVDLLRGVGHIPGSAMAGGLGNMGLAAHRDTYFRALKYIHDNIDVFVSSKRDRYHYRVDSTEVVTPEEVHVLTIGQVPQLTLITCYPFDYIGAAPKRFVVHAHLISLVPTH